VCTPSAASFRGDAQASSPESITTPRLRLAAFAANMTRARLLVSFARMAQGPSALVSMDSGHAPRGAPRTTESWNAPRGMNCPGFARQRYSRKQNAGRSAAPAASRATQVKHTSVATTGQPKLRHTCTMVRRIRPPAGTANAGTRARVASGDCFRKASHDPEFSALSEPRREIPPPPGRKNSSREADDGCGTS
jgi:hypothetical protein